jgi:hypothetical protein
MLKSRCGCDDQVIITQVQPEPTAPTAPVPAPSLAQVEERAQEIITETLKPGRGRPKGTGKHKSDEARKAADALRNRNTRWKKRQFEKQMKWLVQEHARAQNEQDQLREERAKQIDNLLREYEYIQSELDAAPELAWKEFANLTNEEYTNIITFSERLDSIEEEIEKLQGLTDEQMATYDWQLQRQKEVGTGAGDSEGMGMRDAPQGCGLLIPSGNTARVPQNGADVSDEEEPNGHIIGEGNSGSILKAHGFPKRRKGRCPRKDEHSRLAYRYMGRDLFCEWCGMRLVRAGKPVIESLPASQQSQRT